MEDEEWEEMVQKGERLDRATDMASLGDLRRGASRDRRSTGSTSRSTNRAFRDRERMDKVKKWRRARDQLNSVKGSEPSSSDPNRTRATNLQDPP